MCVFFILLFYWSWETHSFTVRSRQTKRRMRLSASIAVGVGCASVVQVSSFAFVPLGAPSGCTSCVGSSYQQVGSAPWRGIVEESGRDGQQSHALARKPIHGLAAVMNIGPHNSKQHRKHMQATPSCCGCVTYMAVCHVDGYGQKMAAAAAVYPRVRVLSWPWARLRVMRAHSRVTRDS